jgi:hypothetical protein
MMQNGPRGILNLARGRKRKDGERGQVMVLFTLVIVLLMVLAAVVIDAGLLRTDAARLQNALDAGALAAAQSLPANKTNVAAVKSTATSFAQANFPGLGTPDTKFACIIGIDSATGGPHFIDMPAVCNVAVGSTWVCTAAVCWAPCDPVAQPTDVCNTIILKDSVTRDYTFARAVGINSGNTGTLQAAACTGPCGPTQPVDVVLIIDRTGSMSGLENTLYNGANAVLQAYDPTIQHIALGMLGPSSQDTACSTGAYGRILNNSAPAIASSTTADVQSAGNVTAGATTLVINKPTATAEGDFLVAGITVNGGSGVTITPPSGWTLITRTNNGTNVGMASYRKFATASEPASYTWGFGASVVRASGGILRYTGVDTANPINVSGGATGNAPTAPFRVTAPAVNTSVAQTAIVGLYGIATGTAYSANSSLTEQFDTRNPNAVGPSTQGATGSRANTGSTGTDYATAGAAGQWVAQHIALTPIPIANYPGTNPPYSDATLKADMSKWIPVGLTGTTNADVLESYRNANGTVNASSKIAKTIGCVLPPNGLTQGTDQASPFDYARAYLVGTSLTPAHARPTVTTGIIFETDGTPQTTNFTCQQAQTAAAKAKAAGIEVFTIGYFASNGPNQNCPDSSGAWRGKKVIESLAAMATNSATVSTAACDANENTDGDHFYCTPLASEISNVFRSAALALASGSRLVQMYPQPVVTSVGGGGGSAGGATITIGGQFFTEAYSVTIGGLPASSFTVVSDTQIRAVTPAGPANTTVDVQVSTPGGSSNITGASKYTYGP